MLDVQGEVKGLFTEVGGLGSETEVVEHKVSRDGIDFVQKIPGRLKWGDITLKRGITAEMDMWSWRAKVEKG
ncbi:MAG: phage tail protein, partial [Anaerolineae bacterium]|nr:phage tail protein [Anaerolineae bacterium]